MAHTTEIMNELDVTITTANEADFGCPAPSSFPILTLLTIIHSYHYQGPEVHVLMSKLISYEHIVIN